MAGKGDIVEQALKLVMGVGEKTAPKAAVRAYHVSPHDFDVFKPSEFRGSTFFSSTPERAKRGAEAGRNEMVMETATELPPVNWRTYEVEIDPSRVKGLSLTPSESKWFEGLPGKIVGDDALAEATKGIPPGMYWDDFYDETPVKEGVYEYTKKSSPPSMSYEDAINKNRDIYRQQWPHYAGSATDEKASASRLSEQGMGGYLVQDEGGLSFAINDPSVVKILRKYTDGGRIAKDNGGKVDPYAEEIASAKRLLEEKAYDDQSWSDWAGDAAENAIRTARSILPTALGGEGEVGISDIARGAYEAGKDAVTFPGDVITGKQALFDEAGRPLESAVARSFNAASTIGGASSAILVPDNSLRVFGGIKSLTADKPALRQAIKMESKGANPDEIWDNTGWFKGADGNWRYEIPDIGTTVNSAALQLDLSKPTIQPIKSAKLGDYLQHPKFFAAYPQFRGMDVSTTSNNPSYLGMYYPRFVRNSSGAVTDPRIELNESLLLNGDLQKSTLLHEIQHAIQQKEGFAPGTNIAVQPFDRVNPKFERYNTAIQSDPDMQSLMKIQNSEEYRDQIRKSNALFSQTAQPKLLELQNSPLPDVEKDTLYDRILEEYRAENEKIAPLIKEAERLSSVVSAKNIPLRQPKEFFTPTEAYMHYAGETEARNVQNRRNLREEDLRGTRPWDTQEYPYMDQLLPLNNFTWRFGYESGGEVDDDIDDAIRIAKDVGGGTSTPVMLEDAKGNKYDVNGNIIPPTNPGPNPQRSDADMTKTYQALSSAQPQGSMDAVYAALDAAKAPKPKEQTDLEYWNAMPPEARESLIAQYPELKEEMRLAGDIDYYEKAQKAKASQPYSTQSMTHDASVPRTEMKINMPLFGGEYSMGTAPYDVAEGLQGMAQTAYDFKTAPAYFFPPTAPLAFGADILESRLADDPTGFILNAALTPQGASAAKSAIGAIRRNPKAVAAAIGAGAYLSPDEAEAGPARWFSKAMEVARALPMEKMTGQQALAMLRKGVSPEELKWTGADAFLPQQKQITKQDLVDYLAKNRSYTQDKVLGGNRPTRREDVRPSETAKAPFMEDWNILKEKRKALDEEYYSLPPEEQASRQSEFLSRQYQLYTARDALKSKIVDATIAEMGGLANPVRYGPGSAYGERFVTRGGKDYQETLMLLPHKKYGDLYSSGHWEGYPNVLGHIRTQILDVTPPGANRPYKAFNVDEAQSDWAKAGREKGFVTPEDKANYPMMSKQYDQLNAERRRLETDVRYGDDSVPEIQAATAKLAEVNRQMEALDEKMATIRGGGIPVAPYVTGTQGWTDLSIKKALDQAMDAGADYFTFTPGEAQAKRYSLRNEVQGLAYDPEEKTLSFYPKDGRGWQDVPDAVPREDLKKYVGEEAAKKLLAQEPNALSGNHILEGIDLEFGGEGMIDYYNNIYKKRVEKVVKDATGKKVQWEVIPVQTADRPREQLGFRLTDDMKEARFSDFKKGGRVTNKANYADSPDVSRALALTRD